MPIHKTLLLNDYSLNFIYAIYVHNNIEYRFGVHLATKLEFFFLLTISIHSFICDVDMYDGKLAEKHYMRRWGELKFYFILFHHIIL
jgi:hypothetical protein